LSNFGRLQATAGNHPVGNNAAIFEPQPGEVEQGNFLVDCIVNWGLDDDGEPAAEVKWFRWGHGHNSVVKLNLIGHDSPLVRTFIRKLEREEQRWHFLQGKQALIAPAGLG